MPAETCATFTPGEPIRRHYGFSPERLCDIYVTIAIMSPRDDTPTRYHGAPRVRRHATCLTSRRTPRRLMRALFITPIYHHATPNYAHARDIRRHHFAAATPTRR